MKQNASLFSSQFHSNKVQRTDEKHVDQANQLSSSKAEVEFNKAHHAVQCIATDIHSNAQEKCQQMLSIGLQYLVLENAVMGSVVGPEMTITSHAGDVAVSNRLGETLLIGNTLFEQALDTSETIAIHNVTALHPPETNQTRTDAIRCFVGRQIDTANGPFGLIGFYSSQRREFSFTSHQIEFVNFMSECLGLIMGYEERIELLTHHTEFYRPMLRIVPAMILLCDKTGLIIANSRRLSASLGVETDSMPGRNVRRYVHPKDHITIDTVLQQEDVENIPISLCLNENKTVNVEMSSCVKSIGTMQGIRVVVLTDVSERMKAMKEIEKTNRQLTRANQSLDQFASLASHDLQEPLRKIQQFSEFLREDLNGQMTSDVNHHLNVILKASKRMTGLVRDILQLSRTSQDNPVLDEVNLSELIDDVIEELDLRIEEANASITVSALPNVHGDSGLIRQLFTNLISNSLKYRDSSRDAIIIISAVFDADGIAIDIRDNGIGFNPEQTTAAFEPFSRLHSSSEYSGNGIGLTICQKVCDQHNWTLTASSEPNVGSIFTICIPTNT